MSDLGFYLVQALTGLASASALFLVASGLSIIFGVTRVVNFAHGSFYMLGAYIAYTFVEQLAGAFGFWAAVLLAGVAVGFIGVVVELLILRRVYQAPELFQLVATFGVILVIQDLALLVWGAEDLFGPAAPRLEGTVNILGTRLPEYDLALIVLSLVVLGALWLLFHRTRWGTLVRAATEDREMVGALGVNQAWLFTGSFFLGSMLAGLGGAAQLPKGGDDGILGIWPSEWASDRLAFYYLSVLASAGGILALQYVLHPPYGYAMRACRDSVVRSASIGIDAQRQQWFAFAFSGMPAGLAGGLFVFSKGSVFPDEMSIPRSFGGVQAVDDVSFTLDRGRLLALIGPNGAGKTTCFNIINGQLAPGRGTIRTTAGGFRRTAVGGAAAMWSRRAAVPGVRFPGGLPAGPARREAHAR